MERLVPWLDTYGRLRGSYSPEQQQRLGQLREQLKSLLAAGGPDVRSAAR
jgi:hypothetical protein